MGRGTIGNGRTRLAVPSSGMEIFILTASRRLVVTGSAGRVIRGLGGWFIGWRCLLVVCFGVLEGKKTSVPRVGCRVARRVNIVSRATEN